ncbi:alpha/beta fold hydrolase [Sphingopyxis panaciterrulae]|jgi:pimeloyl-ACP methyl ester carboxylesterase|uniref:Pimeloyl-ACP methyl ester carboxylesterase n=1 Tax=Sphingopyxis panaciterrulae TaxID=462372 RepID=A0A7W9ES95_9SPHN|nr:alpha/beta fold hydrolase [Sphingopyxis panaciterrulae]MBB5706696.1 pimeloyl-ACP methyl ester carboxylesterase [Sphingopyxis panaciterrulae]
MTIPVIAICGIATDAASWRGMPVTRIFVPRGRTVAAMAAAILSELPERFALCGHSMGGYVALEIARQAGERMAGLALLSTSAAADSDEQRAARDRVIAQAKEDFEGVAQKLAPAMLSRVSRAVPGLLDETHAMLMRCDGALFAEQQAAAAGRPDYRASLAAVSAPTLILAGEEDRIVAPDRSREIAAAIAHADLCLVPACGHVPQREAPDFTAAALRRWAGQAR